MSMIALGFAVRGVAVPFVRVNPGKNGNVFEEKHYAHWKSLVIDAAREEMERDAWKTAVGPVHVDIEIVLIRRPTKKPPKSGAPPHPIAAKSVGDIDNLAKGCLDGMQRALVFKNDAQVVELQARKRWQRHGEDFAGAIVRVGIVE